MFEEIYLNFVIIVYLSRKCFDMKRMYWSRPKMEPASMSMRRWNRMLQLEETYKLARIIKRSMKQVESEPSMTPEEAVETLRALISDAYLRDVLKRMDS
jgi:hypothetical protein